MRSFRHLVLVRFSLPPHHVFCRPLMFRSPASTGTCAAANKMCCCGLQVLPHVDSQPAGPLRVPPPTRRVSRSCAIAVVRNLDCSLLLHRVDYVDVWAPGAPVSEFSFHCQPHSLPAGPHCRLFNSNNVLSVCPFIAWHSLASFCCCGSSPLAILRVCGSWVSSRGSAAFLDVVLPNHCSPAPMWCVRSIRAQSAEGMCGRNVELVPGNWLN